MPSIDKFIIRISNLIFPSLRRWLGWGFLGMALFPLILSGIFIGLRSSENLITQSKDIQQEITTNIGMQIESYIDTHINDLILISEIAALETLPLQEQEELLNRILFRKNSYQEIALLDASGQELFRHSRTEVILKEALINKKNQAVFLVPKEQGNIYYSPVRFDENLREPLMTISIPLYDLQEERLAYVIIADLRLKPVWEMLGDPSLTGGKLVYVLDDHGQVIAHKNPSVVLKGTFYDLPQESGVTTGLDGSNVVLVYNTLQFGSISLHVVSEQAVNEAYRLAYESILISAAVISIAALIAFSFFYISIRRIVIPVESYADALAGIAKRDFSRPLMQISGNDEISLLGNAFMDMRDQLQELLTNLEGLVDERTLELTEAVKELEAFSYSVSHDLRSPLRAMNGFAHILRENYGELIDDEGKDYLNRIIDASVKMDQLISGLLDLSQLGQLVMNMTKVDIGKFADKILREFVDNNPENQISYQVKECPPVQADEVLIEIMLRNLISNAIKFSSCRQEPQIEFGYNEDDQAFYIKDNGIGFDMAFADKIFSPFNRIHPQLEIEGTGIGLAIVQRIITKHWGKIWVYSDVDIGTTFYFTLNLANNEI